MSDGFGGRLCDDGCYHGDEGTCGGKDALLPHSATRPVYGDHEASVTTRR